MDNHKRASDLWVTWVLGTRKKKNEGLSANRRTPEQAERPFWALGKKKREGVPCINQDLCKKVNTLIQ